MTEEKRGEMSSFKTISRGKKVVSLLPSATEVFSLFAEKAGSHVRLVGRSHECDRPEKIVKNVPILTAGKVPFTTSAEVDKKVSETLANSTSLYFLDTKQLKELQPNVILTQDICSVCAIDLDTVEQAVEEMREEQLCGLQVDLNTEVVCLNPLDMKGIVVDQVQKVGKALQLEEVSEVLIQSAISRVENVNEKVRSSCLKSDPPKVLFLEWLNPPYLGGHWTAEMIHMVGGIHPWNIPADRSDECQWKNVFPFTGAGKSVAVDPASIVKTDADIVVIGPCGLDLKMAEEQLEKEIALPSGQWMKELTAVKAGNVYLVDGNAMFNRPGPTIIHAYEWLASVVQKHILSNSSENSEKWVLDEKFPYKKWSNMSNICLDSTIINQLTDIEDIHRTACQKKEAMYKDPSNDLYVLTEYFLRNRGTCCGNRCRHCPYGHINVKDSEKRTNTINSMVFLLPSQKTKFNRNRNLTLFENSKQKPLEKNSLVFLFWSGGKDSFLSLCEYYRMNLPCIKNKQIVLITTIDPVNNIVPIQNISVDEIVNQAKQLNLPLCLIPITTADNYTEKVLDSLKLVPDLLGCSMVDALVFGDLHLQDIRDWKENAFGSHYGKDKLYFPLWNRNLRTDLIPKLFAECEKHDLSIVVSAAESPLLQSFMFVGSSYTQTLVESLPVEVDPMGENGEFHTMVCFNARNPVKNV